MGIFDSFTSNKDKQQKQITKKKNVNDPNSKRRVDEKISFYVPFYYFFDDNKSIVALKNNGLMKVYEVFNNDLTYIDNIDDVLEGLNSALKLIDDGLAIHYETRKTSALPYKEKISDYSSIPTSIVYEKRKELFKNFKSYDIRHFITISYFPDFVTTKDLDEIVATTGNVKKEDFLKQKRELLKEFNMKIEKFLGVFKRAVASYNELFGDELMDFLYKTLNPIERKISPKAPPIGYPLDEILPSTQILYRNGTLLMDKTYVKTISIRIFADTVIPQFFSQLENFDFPFRMVNRFIGLSKKEALSSIKRIRAYQKGKRFSILEIIQKSVFGAKNAEIRNSRGDETRIEKANETMIAEQELKAGKTSYGYYTFSFIIYGDSFKQVEDRATEVVNYIDELGFTCVDDKLNTDYVFFGCIPGNITQNIRRSPIDTRGLSDLIPISSLYTGSNWDEKIKAPNLFTTITEGKIFHFNNKVGQVGHTIVLGKTGYGKSVLLLFMVINFLKYKCRFLNKNKKTVEQGSQVFIFDKGATSKALTYLVGGNFYDLDSEDHMAFQPLRHIDEDRELEWSIEWVIELVRIQAPALADNIEAKDRIADALTRLATTDVNRRTMTGLLRFIGMANDVSKQLNSALKFYTNDGPYGAYFDSIVEDIDDARVTTFEVGNTIENKNIFAPICLYLFHVIDNKMKNGIPTMMVIDEVHNFLKVPAMSDRIQKSLKEWRKLNGTIVMATQELDDLKASQINSTLKSQTATKIFLPNPEALEESNYNLYKEYGKNNSFKKII